MFSKRGQEIDMGERRERKGGGREGDRLRKRGRVREKGRERGIL